jgi:hypothetical protein
VGRATSERNDPRAPRSETLSRLVLAFFALPVALLLALEYLSLA